MLNPCTYPERVCPWWIEPLGSSNLKGYPNLPLQNKEHVQNPLGLNGFANDGQLLSVHFSNLRC